MGKLTNQFQDGEKIFDMLSKKADNKLLSSSAQLGLDKFVFERHNNYVMTFYDTVDNLLTSTGILLYRTQENGKFYFKVEKLNFLPNVRKLHKAPIFEHEVTAKDTPSSVAFYIINGISQLFSTQFFIDLEHVVKVAVPKLEIEIQGTEYKGFSGNGFKCAVEFQNLRYRNFVTRKKHKNFEAVITHTSSKHFEKDFEEFLERVEKYCKELLPKTLTRYDYGNNVTKILEKKPREKKRNKEKEKERKVENTIQG